MTITRICDHWIFAARMMVKEKIMTARITRMSYEYITAKVRNRKQISLVSPERR
jgi:hypothetical protein